MEVDFTPEQEAQLSQIASYHGTGVAQLVKDAALRIVEEDRLFLEAVEKGIEQADRGSCSITRKWLLTSNVKMALDASSLDSGCNPTGLPMANWQRLGLLCHH